MAIRAITNGLHSRIEKDTNFQIIFNDVIFYELRELVSSNTITDDCIFININPTEKGSTIVFHDGGATYDQNTNDMKYTNYLEVESEISFDESEILYYSMTEKVICFLSER